MECAGFYGNVTNDLIPESGYFFCEFLFRCVNVYIVNILYIWRKL
jgi:hypothetical protein